MDTSALTGSKGGAPLRAVSQASGWCWCGGGPDAVRVGVPEHAAQHDDETKHGETY